MAVGEERTVSTHSAAATPQPKTETHLNDTVENDNEGEKRREEDRGSHGGRRERGDGWRGSVNVSLGLRGFAPREKYAP